GDVGALLHRRFLRMCRAHEQDRAAALLPDHVPHARARREEAAVEVDGDDLAPVGEGEINDVVDVLYAGVADEDIDAAEQQRCSFSAAIDLSLAGDVHSDVDGVFYFGCGLIQVCYATPRPRLCENASDLGADAACGTGDDGGFSGQGHGSS